MTLYRLPTLDWAAPIVDGNGRVTPYFQRFWQNVSLQADEGASVAPDVSNKVDKGTSGGWAAATGTSSKTTFATYAAPTISNPPTQAEVQAIADHLQVLSRHTKALIDAGLSSGLLS